MSLPRLYRHRLARGLPVIEYRGIAYPVEKTPYGLLSRGTNLAQINGSILTIISTRPGERVMRPHFGVPLHRLRNKPAELIPDEARLMIAAAIKRWEKRVQVTDVKTYLTGDMLNIEVYFIDPGTSLQEIQQLALQVKMLD